MRKRYGYTFDENKQHRVMFAIPTGQMVDGTLVWTECDNNKNLIDIDTQYTLQTRGGWSEFVRI